MMVDENVELFLGLVKEYFLFRLHLPLYQREFKDVYKRLLREFALAAGMAVAEGVKDRVYLHALLRLSESDFRKATREYMLKTRGLDLNSTASPILFSTYMGLLRKKRVLDQFFMDYAKYADDLETKVFDAKFEAKFEAKFNQDSINDVIERCKTRGWDWLEKSESSEGNEKGDGKVRTI